MRLRYVGALPTTFMTLGLSVNPGDEFEVDDDQAAAFTVRADVEAADPPKPARRKQTKPDTSPPAPVPAGDAPVVDVTPEEVSGGVPDDH